MKSEVSLLVFMKETPWTQIAREFLEANFSNLKIVSGNGKGFPDDFSYLLRHENMEVEWVVSFLSQWIIPPQILNWSTKGSINFHPGPPEYPGTGCYNFAIWDKSEGYGATCHYMEEKVDTGPIIRFDEFPLHGNETVKQLKERTMVCLMEIFYTIMGKIMNKRPLHSNGGVWTSPPTKRTDLQKLCKVDNEVEKWAMGNEEPLERKLRATYFPNAQDAPSIIVNGKKWRFESA